ncbi:hypothetical protein LXA43DRAFT_1016132 [Ganoderma leucocontextum]|nr:hypothetical protein LXA43DRAFT_1016132 [Ganoderma leucocontextum]
MGFALVFAKWISHGVITFATGLLPLFITSQSVLSSLTTVGTGQLLGSGLIMLFTSIFWAATSTVSYAGVSALRFSPTVGALFHIAGILFMFAAERKLSSRALVANPPANSQFAPTVAPQDGMELRKLEQTEDAATQSSSPSRTTRAFGPHQRRIYLFTFALVIKEFASGISIGYAATTLPWKYDKDELPVPSIGPVTMYFFDLVKRIPKALALTTTLLSASVPIAECKRHILGFAAALPSGALLSYNVTKLCQMGTASTPFEGPPFLAIMMLSFTGGMFVYAVLVVRALISNSRAMPRSGLFKTLLLMAGGALLRWVPLAIMMAWMVWSTRRTEP